MLLALPPNHPKGAPEYRGPFGSLGSAVKRAEELERAGVIHRDWWVFPCLPP